MDMSVVLSLHKFSLQASIDHHGPSVYSGQYTTTVMALAHPFHPIVSRSRNKRRNLWVTIYYLIHIIIMGCIISNWNNLRDIYIPRIGVTMTVSRMIWYCYSFQLGFYCIFQFDFFIVFDNIFTCILMSHTIIMLIFIYLIFIYQMIGGGGGYFCVWVTCWSQWDVFNIIILSRSQPRNFTRS